MIMKIVVDTSVLISALIGPQGPGREVLRKCLNGEYHPLIGSPKVPSEEQISNCLSALSKARGKYSATPPS